MTHHDVNAQIEALREGARLLEVRRDLEARITGLQNDLAAVMAQIDTYNSEQSVVTLHQPATDHPGSPKPGPAPKRGTEL